MKTLFKVTMAVLFVSELFLSVDMNTITSSDSETSVVVDLGSETSARTIALATNCDSAHKCDTGRDDYTPAGGHLSCCYARKTTTGNRENPWIKKKPVAIGN